MILQDLIRNYMMYREVLQPLFESWTEPWIGDSPKKLPLTPFYKLNFASSKARNARATKSLDWEFPDHSRELLLTQISGTRTISTVKRCRILSDGQSFEAQIEKAPASPSRETHMLLTDHRVNEFIVDIGKTSNKTHILSVEKTESSLQKTVNATTGYESKQINFFLIPETHEKREYLGEFSLTHEAIHLCSSKKGGEHHDTDQEPITAVV